MTYYRVASTGTGAVFEPVGTGSGKGIEGVMHARSKMRGRGDFANCGNRKKNNFFMHIAKDGCSFNPATVTLLP